MNSTYKVIIIGSYAAGKTAITNRHIYNTFNPLYHLTIGANYFGRKIKFDNHKEITVNLWDCAGNSDQFYNLMPIFFKHASVALIVYDVTNVTSYQHSLKTIDFLRDHLDNVIIVLVGNKIDLTRTVPTNEAMLMAKQYHVYFYECSAKTGQGVHDLFEFVDQQLILLHQKHPMIQQDHVVLNSDDDLLSCCYK